MRLSKFISSNTERILIEWEDFARSCLPAAATMNVKALRNDAHAILEKIALDLQTPQTAAQQSAKSKGHSDSHPVGETNSAQSHGTGRADDGFTMEQLVSEYRALRANVLRLWLGTGSKIQIGHPDDITRFNEAIDQALAESVQRFVERLNRSREMFLAILGHDLRNPLYGITMMADSLLKSESSSWPHRKSIALLLDSAEHMKQIIADLLDYTRGRLGSGIPVNPAEMDMKEVVDRTVGEITASHPERTIQVEMKGMLRGSWDSARLRQMFGNLILNAIEHGAVTAPIAVAVRGAADAVVLSVHNQGQVIPRAQLAHIYEPMKYLFKGGYTQQTNNLGLGLYICHQIVMAHGGKITATSSKSKGTTFTVRLPRHRGTTAPVEQR